MYKEPSFTVNSIITKLINQEEHVLLITRGRPPYEGMHALPSSFVNYGEDPEDACLFELQDKYCLEGYKPS